MSRSLFITLFFLCGLLSREARAEFVVVDDSQRVLSSLSSWTRPGAFEKVMACGQSASFEATTPRCELRCDSIFCRSSCDTYQTPTGKGRYDLHVDDCSEGIANVYGDNGLMMEVTKADYEAGAGTFVLPFLRQFGQFVKPEGEIHLDWMFPTQTQFILDGQLITISAYVVEANIVYPGIPQRQRIRTVWTDQLTGSRQLLYVRFGDEDVFLKARGLVGEISQ